MMPKKRGFKKGLKPCAWLRSSRGRRYLFEKIEHNSPLDPDEICYVLETELEKRSRARYRSKKKRVEKAKAWDKTYFRISLREFNCLRNESDTSLGIDDDYRARMVAASIEVGIVIGIGRNAVTIAHDTGASV